MKRLKLNVLEQKQLKNQEMNAIQGGRTCTCSCAYEGNTGSSAGSNMSANYGLGPNGGHSITGNNAYGISNK